jgi:hypothetical protein
VLTVELRGRQTERGPLSRLGEQLVVTHVIERADIANLPTIDDEAEKLGFPHCGSHRRRGLTALQCELPFLLQLREERVADRKILGFSFDYGDGSFEAMLLVMVVTIRTGIALGFLANHDVREQIELPSAKPATS